MATAGCQALPKAKRHEGGAAQGAALMHLECAGQLADFQCGVDCGRNLRVSSTAVQEYVPMYVRDSFHCMLQVSIGVLQAGQLAGCWSGMCKSQCDGRVSYTLTQTASRGVQVHGWDLQRTP